MEQTEAIERTMDAIRIAVARVCTARRASEMLRALPGDYGRMCDELQKRCDDDAETAWRTIRPALRRLIADVQDANTGISGAR